MAASLSGATGSSLLAFGVGALTTYFDCYSTLTTRIGRVPGAFISNPFVVGLSLVCGAIAAIACWVSGHDPKGVISTVLTLQAPDPWRGIVAGASVLILIRSKLFNIHDSPFGGDYLYQLGRDTAIHDVNSRWTIVRSSFQNLNIEAARQDPQFEARIAALLAANIRARPAAFQVQVNAAMAAATANRPASPFRGTDPAWEVHYRALIGVALDASGPGVVRTLPGFR